MRKIIFNISILLFTVSHAFAQSDTLIGTPPGYTISQMRSVKGLAIDQSGNVWIPFSLVGLAKFDGSAWTVYDSLNSGLLKNKILSVAANTMGIWAGSDTGLYNFDGAIWNRMTVLNSNLISDTITKLYSPGGVDLYILSNKGFSYFNGTIWQHYNTLNSGLVNDTVQCIYKTAAGNCWIGTRNGLSKFDGSTWQNFTTSNSSIYDNDIRGLCEDGNNNLFIGTAIHGLLFYSGNEFLRICDSISSFYNLPQTVANLFKLQDGRVLFSTSDDYYFTLNPVDVTSNPVGFSASDTIYYSAVDAHDRIWKILGYHGQPNLYMRDSLQSNPLPPPSFTYADLDINKVRCGIANNNSLHWDLTGWAKYEVPRGSGVNAVFASALWIGGLDTSGKLHMAAQTYRQSGNDFWPGPLDTVNAQIDSATSSQYDSIWKINRHMIDEFITQFNAGNVTNGSYSVPDIILNWPAHGTGNYSRNLAPFTDLNSDGIYNPYDGDYPEIKGDQMLWWVMNDNLHNHGETDGHALGIEIHSKAYAYNCLNIADSAEAVNYTTFYSFEIINRSDTDYHDVYIGMFVDNDLGNYLDDYVGCNVENDFAFAYNGDNNDEGIAGYGLNPPMQSAAILKGPLADPEDSLDNNHNGIIDEPAEQCMLNHFMYYNNNGDACQGNPSGAQDHYNYLQSIWRCGTHLTYGGYGNGGGIGGTNIPTDYFYPGTPYDTGWTETSAGISPDDRRFVMSSGPFSLRKGETRTIDYAYVFTRDESAPNGLNTSVAKNIADVQRVKRWFDTDSFPCNNSSIGIEELNENNIGFSIYPNPATESLYVIRYSLFGTAVLELYDLLGQKIHSYLFPAAKKEFKINTGNLPAGVYFLRLVNGDSFSTKKIVVR